MKRLASLIICLSLYSSPQVAYSDCPKTGDFIGGKSSTALLDISIMSSFMTSCFTTSAEDKVIDDREQLEHFIKVSYSNLYKEAATGCDEYVDALYRKYIDAMYVDGKHDEILTNKYFCQILHSDYEKLFINNKYHHDFLPKLDDRVKTAVEAGSAHVIE